MLGGGGELVNANPTIYAVEDAPDDAGLAHNLDDDDEEGESDAFDAGEVFEILRRLRDPEHPLTLEQLNVVSRELIEVGGLCEPSSRRCDAAAFASLPHDNWLVEGRGLYWTH